MAPPPRPWCRTPQGAPWSSKNEDGVEDADVEDGVEGSVDDGVVGSVDDGVENGVEDGSKLTVILFNLARCTQWAAVAMYQWLRRTPPH